MGGVQRGGVRQARLGHPGQVLDAADAVPRGRDRVHQAQMTRDAQVERLRLVEHRLEQGRVDPGVDLDQVGAGIDQAVHRLAGIPGGVGAERIGIGRGQAVDHGAGTVHPGSPDRPGVHLLAQAEDGIERPVEIPHRGHAPGQVSGERPALDVRVRVDETRNDPAPGHIDLPRLRRKLKPRAGAHRLDPAAAHDDGRVRQRRTAAAVDQGGADERHAVRRLAPAGRSRGDRQAQRDDRE